MTTDKIGVLMVPSDLQGVGNWRNIWPAIAMEKYHSDEFFVEINQFPNFDDIEYLKKFKIIHFHRQLGPKEFEDMIFDRVRSLGITTVMDIDDYWEPFTGHPLYLLIMNDKYPEKITKTLTMADYVTTTTGIFANEIKKYNKNVFVIPNAPDLTNPMWDLNDEKLPGDERCRISWIGGSSHLYDLKLMDHSFTMLWNNQELKNKFQIQICGFDTRGTVTQIDELGRQNQRPIQPHETSWARFEEIFTSNYQGTAGDPEYTKWLKKIEKGDYPNVLSKPYMRRWTMPLTKYAKHYDYCDVCLAPLDEFDEKKSPKGTITKEVNMFNLVKSELKIIEAGMKKKALIAQDFGIYKELLTHGENALLVNKNSKGWYQAMRQLILDKDLRDRLAENLHNFVKDKYDIKNVTKDRVAIYKQILEKQKAVVI